MNQKTQERTRKQPLRVAVSLALGLLVSTASLGQADSLLLPNDSPGGGNAFATDLWRVKCKKKTQIRARVLDRGLLHFDKTYHVTLLCATPKRRKPGSPWLDKAIATDGQDKQGDANGATAQNPSTYARVFGCKEAFVLFSCELGDWCDGVYGGEVECVDVPIKTAVQLQNE